MSVPYFSKEECLLELTGRVFVCVRVLASHQAPQQALVELADLAYNWPALLHGDMGEINYGSIVASLDEVASKDHGDIWVAHVRPVLMRYARMLSAPDGLINADHGLVFEIREKISGWMAAS